ncbi:hypothetical protein WJX84_011670 [Apatococcus fuscideae]|uniref:Uncharacterized protein n=1 Tax=Apatococcus fuscideae TaxID=2026836 RepID=A0AAW1SXD8_9CHLO
MADLRQAVFQRLRPICAQLLPLRSSAGRLARELDSLQVVICSANLEGLASCLEYVLFPLLFLVDSICAVRRRSGSGGASEPPAFPAAASGQRFGAVAALPRDAATEEVRMGEEAAAAAPPGTAQNVKPGERPQRDLAWTQAASGRICALLRQVLPPLCSHPRPAVRAAIPGCVMELVGKCSTTLQPCMEVLIELMLTLAQDAWPQVCKPCRAWLTQPISASSFSQLSDASLTTILDRLVAGLRRAVETGQQAGCLHAQRLASAFMAWPPHLTHALLTNSAQLSTLCSALAHCFEFSPSAAALLLYADPQPGPYTSARAASQPPPSQPLNPSAAALASSPPSRAMGRAASSQPGSIALHALIDQLLEQFQAHLPSGNNPADPHRCHHLLDPADPWQCKAASVICVLSETIFGASNAWVHPWHDPAASRSPISPPRMYNDSCRQGHVHNSHWDPTADQRQEGNAGGGSRLELDTGMMVMVLEELAQSSIRSLATHNEPGPGVSSSALTQQGLSITARTQRPHLAKPFLQVLQETVAGSKLDADAALQGLRALALTAEARLRAQRAAHGLNLDGQEHDRTSGADNSPTGQASMEEIHDYFQQQQNSTPDEPTFDTIGTVQLSEDEVESVKELRSRIHADASLASTAADTAAPLLFSSSTQVVLGAMELCCRALHTLAATIASLDVLEDVLWPGVEATGNLEAPPPTTPKLLPSVHLFWAPLMAALQDKRAAVVERAMHALTDMAQTAGGDFLARRFTKEAWPLMQAHLQDPPKALTRHSRLGSAGQTTRASGPFGDQEGLAPAAVQKLRHTALTCIAAILGHPTAASALQSLAKELAEAAIACLNNHNTPPVHSAAAEVIKTSGQFEKTAVTDLLIQAAQASTEDTAGTSATTLAAASRSRYIAELLGIMQQSQPRDTKL